MDSPTPGDAGLICHYCRCLSPHVYTCRACGEDFCLQCVETALPGKPQVITCPRCGGRDIASRTSDNPAASG